MTASPLSSPTEPEVEEYLRSVAPEGAVLRLNDDEPLLVVQLGNVIGCFAFAGGEVEKEYASVYSSFKKAYLRNESKWLNADLALVVCVPPSYPVLDQFRSRVETDVFFCRKFVIPLMHPLDVAFARLPFLPLVPLRGGSLRPPSAQTFLQRSGVPASLARDLVVQQQRSAEGIVEDCLAELHGKPREIADKDTLSDGVDRFASATPVQLASLTIENFRAYRSPRTFELGSDITILYGPNGFGKTSFFDAIDFAATGGIGRLRTSSDAHFEKTAAHLDSDPTRSSVSLAFSAGGDSMSRHLTRTVANRRHATLDGVSVDRKSILTALTGGGHSGVDRIDNLVNLFRATHLFSQEQQEFTRDFQDDCRLSGEIVSRLLAFEDYANAVNKVGDVLAGLESSIKEISRERDDLVQQVAADQQEMESLTEGQRQAGATKDQQGQLSATATKLAQAGVDSSSEGADIERVRGWRARLEQRIAQYESEISKLSSLALEASAVQELAAERSSLSARRQELERALQQNAAARLAAESSRDAAQQRVDAATKDTKDRQARLSLIAWVREQKAQYAVLTDSLDAAKSELNYCQSELDHWNLAAQQAQADFAYSDSQARDVTGRIGSKQDELSSLVNLVARLPALRSADSARSEVAEAQVNNTANLAALEATERDVASRLAASQAEGEAISSSISALTNERSEILLLLNELRGHISDGTCPLCGEDHGSKEVLLRRVQDRLAVDSLTSIQDHFRAVQQRISSLSDQLADNRREQARTRSVLAQLAQQAGSIAEQLGQLNEIAARFGFDISATDLESVSAEKTKQVEQELAALRDRVQQAQAVAKQKREELTTARSQVVSLAVKETNLRSTSSSLVQQIERLQADVRLDQIGLATDVETLDSLEKESQRQLAEAQLVLGEANVALAKGRTNVDTLKRDTSTLRNNLTATRARDNVLLQRNAQFVARLSEASLPDSTSSQELVAMIARGTHEMSRLQSLQTEVSNLELAIDAATTAAAYGRLRGNIRVKQQSITSLEVERSRREPWKAYFSSLLKLVRSQQYDAIDLFTNVYGPRASVIQQRLRSVYGFDDVEISAEGSAIVVRVSRAGEELRPTDFFSQSQQQTLLLGLFLTACSSQNWSSFMPIFLDDPVTHFDDLNTYALLDLIAGLFQSDLGRRQFILSTCDAKLFELAQQKFAHLGDGASFYRFGSIGEDGPSVTRIESNIRRAEEIVGS